MVQILPLIGAAALLAQTAFGAAVPVKRTQYSNNYNSGSSGQYEAANQDTNQSGNGNYNYNSYNAYQQQEQNQDSNQNGMANHETTTVRAEMAHETTTVMMEHSSVSREEATTSTAMAHETTSVMAMHETTSSEMAHETSTVEAQETSTSAAYSMPTYGSGSSEWGNNGYNNCVSQCMAQFGSPPSTMTMVGQEALPSATGTGAIHTVLVAPTGAGLRYMPFALNATVGDTVRYVWTTPNNHTATLSSSLAICNKSGIAEQRNFVSGVKNAAEGMQVFDVTVETDQPQFFYCSVAQHCQKGMFGIINPGNNIGAPNTVGTMMNSWLESNPNLQAAYDYAMPNITSSSAKAWGMGISVDGIPEDQYPEVAANILFTQANFAANPGMLETGLGATNPDGSPVLIMSDLNVLLSNSNGVAPTSVNAGAASTTAAADTATRSLTPVNASGYGNGASKSSVGMWVAAVVGVAGWLLI
jgi:plastocyanin